jgi:ParB family chromosome partitioning protein
VTRERRLGRGLEALLGKVATQQAEEQTAALDNSTTGPWTANESPYGLNDQPYSPEPVTEVAEPTARVDTAHEFRSEPQSGPEVDANQTETGEAEASQPEGTGSPTRLDIRLIDSNPYQPREDFGGEELDTLTDSLRAHGLLQPLVVRAMGDRYQLIAGERRLRAAARAGWTEVPILVVEADERETAELAIIENLQRKDLNALEKAASFQRYLDNYGCTQEDLASRLKIDRSTVANLIRLLELPDDVQAAVRESRITQGHARALLPLGDEREQIEFCKKIQNEALSVRKTEALVQEMIASEDGDALGVVDRDGASRKPRATSDHVAALEQEFRSVLGMRVAISHNARGKGKLVVHFANHDEFDRLRMHVCGVIDEDVQNEAG